jgi:hypothetical protein
MVAYEIRELPNNPLPLGRHFNQDPRSANYAYDPHARGVVVGATKSRKHRVYGGMDGILDQSIRNLGDCTCCMLVYAKRCGKNHKPHDHVLMDSDAEKAYEIATVIDPFPGYYKPGDPKSEDTGSDGTSACNAGIQLKWITRFEHVDPTLDNLIQALQEFGVGQGTNWYKGMFNPNSRGFVEPAPHDVIAGGHEYLINEVNLQEEWFGFPQSWGFDWGINGYGKMSFPTVRRLLSEDGDLVIPIV